MLSLTCQRLVEKSFSPLSSLLYFVSLPRTLFNHSRESNRLPEQAVLVFEPQNFPSQKRIGNTSVLQELFMEFLQVEFFFPSHPAVSEELEELKLARLGVKTIIAARDDSLINFHIGFLAGDAESGPKRGQRVLENLERFLGSDFSAKKQNSHQNPDCPLQHVDVDQLA